MPPELASRPTSGPTILRRLALKVPSADHLFVYLTIAAWWLVGPAHFDDGWMTTLLENYQPDGDFGTYFENFNDGQPFLFLHLTLLRLLSWVSTDLIWLRVGSVIAALVAWHLSRSTVDRVVRRSGREPSTAVHLVLAGAFVLGWIAWNMTLRGEPLIALFSALSLWAAVRFAEAPHGRFLLLGAVVTALGASTHPAGAVVLAPWVPLIVPIIRWIREMPVARILTGLAIALVAVTTLVLLVWGPQGYGGWYRAVHGYATRGEHSFGLLDEYRHYTDLYFGGNAVRRLAVMLPAMGAVLFLGRRGRGRDPVLALPVWSAVAGTLLLAFTPSKWLWHFGALVSLAAVALATEWALWRDSSERSMPARIAALVALVMINTIGWYGLVNVRWLGKPSTGPFFWVSPLATNSLESTDWFQALLRPLAQPWFWLGLVAMGWLVHLFRSRAAQRRSGPALGPWTQGFVSSLLVFSLGLAVAIPVAAFALDGFVLTPGWTMAKQNVDAALASTCGLSDEVLVERGDGPPAEPLAAVVAERGGAVFVAPQLRIYFPCWDQPAISNGVAEVPSLIICAPNAAIRPGEEVAADIRGCVGWPLDIPSSPHWGIADVAIVTPLAVEWPNRGDVPTIYVATVDIVEQPEE